MIEAHRRIAEMYAGDGAAHETHPMIPRAKPLERRDFYDNCWKAPTEEMGMAQAVNM